MSFERKSIDDPRGRRDWDCWLVCGAVLGVYFLLLNRSLPEGVAAMLERAAVGNWKLGPHVGYQLLLFVANPLADGIEISLALLAAALNAVAVTCGTLVSLHVFRTLGMTGSGAVVSALMTGTCPPVLLGATVAGPQGILFFLLSLATLATIKLGREASRGWATILAISLCSAIAVDTAAMLAPLALAVLWLISSGMSIAHRAEHALLSAMLAFAVGIAVFVPQQGELLLGDWLRGLFPLSWVSVYCLLRERTRVLSVVLLLGALSASSVGTGSAHGLEGIRLLPFLWPAVWLASAAISKPGLHVALMCVGIVFGVARVKLFDVSEQAVSYAEGLRAASSRSVPPYLILGSEADHALARLQSPPFDQISIDALIQFLERAADREILGETIEETLEQRITGFLSAGRQVFLTRSAEDMLRDPAFRIRHHVAVRAMDLLRSHFKWTFIDQGAFLAHELSLPLEGK